MSYFRERLEALSREDLLELIRDQDSELFKQVRRIEWVFENKLGHLTWDDGTPITSRPLTNKELALLIDEPFAPNEELTKLGLTIEQQRQFHIASDTVLWAKHFLGATPRAYQVLILRHGSKRKVLRAGRRLGKTWLLAVTILHYSFTHNDGRVVVVAPMKSQVELIYKEVLKLASKSGLVNSSITRKPQSPQYSIEFSNGSSVKFFTSGIKCLTPDHDVLTYEEGWKPIGEIGSGTKVLSWKDGNLLWSKAEASYSYNYEGKLLSYKGRQLSFRATPEHKWRVRSSNNTKYRWVESGELKDGQVIPGSGTPIPFETKTYSAEEMELWGWWLSEGSGFIGNAARFSQKKEPGLSRIIELVRELGFTPQKYTYGDKASEIRVLGWKPPIFSGSNCYNKFIPRQLLLEEHRDKLLLGLLGGDGWYRRKGWEYSSSSFELINGIQELALLEGFRVLLRPKEIKYEPVDGGEPNPHWIVSAYPYDGWTVTRNQDRMVWEDYSGPVHCLNVPETGTFIVRHNGAVHVTGNSGGKADVVRGQEAHIIILDELDYMHNDDLESLYAMLQKTAEDQEEKIMIGASTPSGRREAFWNWSHGNVFQEFWFPSYTNPFWSNEMEEELRNQYTEMGYRHEIEADWGEDAQGVYLRRYVDAAFITPAWEYRSEKTIDTSFYVMGVDWDKFGAGVNIVVLEVCGLDYSNPTFQNKIRLIYRQETKKEEFTYTKAIARIVELNEIFSPRHIYIDRGSGEVQSELLHQHGIDHPQTGLREKVKGISFSETFEMRDPSSKELIKKEIKPFMVDNLSQMLEQGKILFPAHDQELYMQLISYIVVRTTVSGRPIFEASGSQVDHAHDALILACLSITQNYGKLLNQNYAVHSRSVSNANFLPILEITQENQEKLEDQFDSPTEGPLMQKRAFTATKRKSPTRPIRRRIF